MRSGKRAVAARPRILDVGTGTGVLAIAAARALRARVLATDIDAFAVRTARSNARHNRAGSLRRSYSADGVGARDDPPARALRPGLRQHSARAAANASPRHCARLAAPGGRVVLSGMLPSQANAVIAAYRPLALQRRLDIDGWTTLVLVRTRRW